VIKLTRSRAKTSIPTSFKGANLAKKAKALIALYYDARTKGTSIDFSSAPWKPAKDALKKETGGKCAYCEASTETVAHGDVEHFRPKSIYWWLAFCYDNYLFACQLCNQTYKGNNFPVFGPRVLAPEMPDTAPIDQELDALAASLTLDAQVLSDAHLVALWSPEDAYLVNPYFEDPSLLFGYEVDIANEEIWIRSAGGGRADRAVDAAERFLGLNRETLRRDRFTAYAELLVLRAVIQEPSLQDQTRMLVEQHIAGLQKQRHPFSGMLRWFAVNLGLPGPA